MKKEKSRKIRRDMKHLEFIIDCGSRGKHLLFSPGMIRNCFTRDEDQLNTLFEDNYDEVQDILSDTLGLETFEAQRDYIEKLPEHLRDALIYGYFELIDGNMIETGFETH